MNGGAWWAIVRGVAKEWDMTECTHTHTHTHIKNAGEKEHC